MAASPEVQRKQQIDVRFGYPDDPNLGTASATIASNSRVFVKFQVDGIGAWREQPMALNAATGSFSRAVKILEGSSIGYKYVVKTPGQPDQWDPPGGEETNLYKNAEAVPEQSPSPRAPLKAVQGTIERQVKQLLDTGDTPEGTRAFGLRLRAFQAEIGTRLDISTDISRMVIEAFGKVIRNNKKYPAVLRNLFPEKGDPADFFELEARLEEGRLLFGEQVFMEILGNEDARKTIGLAENAPYVESDPFGNAGMNDMFVRECNSRCLGGIGPALNETVGSIAALPSVNPLNQTRLDQLQAEILNRLPRGKGNSIIAKVPEGRKDLLADVLVNGGTTALALADFGGLSFILGGLEGLTGVRKVDLLKLRRAGGGKEVLDKLLKNNIVVDAVTAKEGEGFKALGGRLLQTLGRCIPVVNLAFSGKEVKSHGMYKGPEKGKTPAAQPKGPQAFIRKACDDAVKA